MQAVETKIFMNNNSKISKIISGKIFYSDKEFIETLEDYLFGNIINNSEKGDYVKEEEIFNMLDKNLGK